MFSGSIADEKQSKEILAAVDRDDANRLDLLINVKKYTAIKPRLYNWRDDAKKAITEYAVDFDYNFDPNSAYTSYIEAPAEDDSEYKHAFLRAANNQKLIAFDWLIKNTPDLITEDEWKRCNEMAKSRTKLANYLSKLPGHTIFIAVDNTKHLINDIESGNRKFVTLQYHELNSLRIASEIDIALAEKLVTILIKNDDLIDFQVFIKNINVGNESSINNKIFYSMTDLLNKAVAGKASKIMTYLADSIIKSNSEEDFYKAISFFQQNVAVTLIKLATNKAYNLFSSFLKSNLDSLDNPQLKGDLLKLKDANINELLLPYFAKNNARVLFQDSKNVRFNFGDKQYNAIITDECTSVDDSQCLHYFPEKRIR